MKVTYKDTIWIYTKNGQLYNNKEIKWKNFYIRDRNGEICESNYRNISKPKVGVLSFDAPYNYFIISNEIGSNTFAELGSLRNLKIENTEGKVISCYDIMLIIKSLGVEINRFTNIPIYFNINNLNIYVKEFYASESTFYYTIIFSLNKIDKELMNYVD